VDGKVSVGFSPKAPLAVGISAASTGAATAVAGGTDGPSVAASLELAVPLPDESVDEPEPLDEHAAAASIGNTINGTATSTARKRMWNILISGW